MLYGIAVLCLLAGIILLVALAVIDLRTKLLPNEMVAGFATLGILFHITTQSRFLDPADIIMGGLIGFGSLYILRATANRIYGMDALGLGDVKLIGAGGLWLGPENLMIALILGAGASVLHGLAVALHTARKEKKRPDFARLQIPAGPGLVCGLILTGVWSFKDIFVMV